MDLSLGGFLVGGRLSLPHIEYVQYILCYANIIGHFPMVRQY